MNDASNGAAPRGGAPDAFGVLDALARAVQDAIAGDGARWASGAHGDGPTPKPALDGDGVRYSLSRTCRSKPGARAVEDESARAHDALEAAGCTARVDVFDDGARWVRAERDGSVVVVKLLANGNRLVSAQSPDLPGE